MTTLTVAELTQSTLEGTGVFDVLMRANKAHLEAEFDKGRIKGAEYSTVYLGALQSVMATALAFLVQRERTGLESELLAQQVILAKVGVLKANAELAIVQASLAKIPMEIAQITAQTGLVTQQKVNLTTEALNISKQGLKLDADVAMTAQQTAMVVQQKANLALDAVNTPKQGLVLDGQVCKLKAEFDLLASQVVKSGVENSLLTQKVATEKANTTSLGVDADSLVGRQKALYFAQSEGFKRAAEQKAADVMVSAWNVQRTTNDVLPPEPAMLDGVTVARAITKLLSGVGA